MTKFKSTVEMKFKIPVTKSTVKLGKEDNNRMREEGGGGGNYLYNN